MRFALAFLLLLMGQAVLAQRTDSANVIAHNLYVHRSMRYPEEAREAGVEGVVLVRFTIDAHCTITKKWVERGLGYGLDEVALKVIDRKFEDDLTGQLYPCTPDTLTVPVRFSNGE